MEASPRLWIKGRRGHSNKKHRAGAFALCRHCGPATTTFPWGHAHSLTSQEKEWLDEPPSAPLQWRPLSLFPVQVVLDEVDEVVHVLLVVHVHITVLVVL